jgi:REP-associated tyrosine transposase
MTQPREVLPGKMLMITRRCARRSFYLRPEAGISQLLEYLLAVGAEKHGIKIIGIVVMSSHIHIIVYAPHGNHPCFTQWFNGLIARAGNCYRQRYDSFWAGEQVNVVELADADATLDELVYVAANPVEALLVEHGRDWPGVRSNPQSYLAAPKPVRRPDFFFSDDGPMPEVAYLRYEIPPTHGHIEAQDFAKLLADRIADREAELRNDAREAGKSFLGARGVMKQDWRSQPRRPDVRGPDKIRPNVAASDKLTRMSIIARIKGFRAAYHAAREAYIDGDTSVVFPAGTWAPKRRFGIACAPAPT